MLKSASSFRRWLWLLCLVSLGCAAPAGTGVGLRKAAVDANDAGYKFYQQGKWDLAQEKFRQALKYNRLIDHRAGIASNLANLGAISQEQGDLQQALTYFQEALEIQQEMGDPAGFSEVLNNLGTLYQAQGQWPLAEETYQQACRWAQLIPPGPLLALSFTHLGDVARHYQNYQQALDLYHQALKIDEARKDLRGRAVRWQRLGQTYLAMQEYGRANAYFLDALKEFRVAEDTSGIVDALDGLTRLSLAQGDRPTALIYGERLLKIYQARGQTEEAGKLEALVKFGEGGQGLDKGEKGKRREGE